MRSLKGPVQDIQDVLHWETVHKTDFKDEVDFLDSILIQCGVLPEDIPMFLKPDKSCLRDPMTMRNMDRAVKLVHEVLQKPEPRIFLKVDCDPDGFSSAAVFLQFILAICPGAKFTWQLNYHKIHGLEYKNLTEYTKDEFDLIVIPDASMTVKDARMITRNYSAPILVLDHHLVTVEKEDLETGRWLTDKEAQELLDKDPDRVKFDDYTNYCVAVNCHDGRYLNPDLSGVGVVQKFLEAYLYEYMQEDGLDDGLLEEFYDLVSFGMIADAISALSLEARYYMLTGMDDEHRRNEFLNELQDRNEESFKFGRILENTAWTLAPQVNGVIRYGSEEEQENLFRAIIGVQQEVEYQPRRRRKDDPKPPVEIHSLQWDMARVCGNVKSRQDTEVRKFVKEIEAEIEKGDMLKNSVLFVDGTKVLTKDTVTGLVANKLTSKYFRPVVLMRQKDGQTFGGSGRGYNKGCIDDLNAFLSDCGVTCMGHANSFGVLFKKADLPEILRQCNERCPVDTLKVVHTVDWEIPARKLKKSYISEVAENYAIFGNGVPNPMFAITDLHIKANLINGYGDNYGFIRFIYNGIPFVKKYCPIGDYDRMTMRTRTTLGVNKKPLVLNIIGQFVLNAWEDKVEPEVKIWYYDVREDETGGEDDLLLPGVTQDLPDKNTKVDLDGGDEFFEESPKPTPKITKLTVDDDFIF